MVASGVANLRRTFVDFPAMAAYYRADPTVPSVNQALAAHDEGQFAQSAYLVDAMFRDDRIAGTTATRVNSLLGLPLKFEPKDEGVESAQAQKVCDTLERLWPEMFPREQLAELQIWGLFLGVGLAELIWTTDTADGWVPSIKVWHPQYVYWDWNARRFHVETQSDQILAIEPGDPKWIVYTPYGYRRGWIRGLVRSLAVPWLVRRFTYRDWARYSEVHGLPTRIAKVPSDATRADKDRFRREVSVGASDLTIAVPTGREGEPSYGLDLLEAKANTWEGFDKLLTKAEDSIAIGVLGQNLTTSVKGGSYAAAQVHDTVRTDLLRFDAEALCGALTEQVVYQWVRFNVEADPTKARALCPCVRFETEPPADKGAEAAAFLSLGQAFSAFNAAGVAVDKRQVLENFGIPYTGDGEMDPKVPGVTDAGGKPAENAEGKPADNTGAENPQKAPEDDDAEPEKQSAELSRGERPGWQQGQDYADLVSVYSILAGRDALAPDLEKIVKAVKVSQSPEELKGRLLKAFEGMKPDAMAKVHQRSMMLARLMGRYSVLVDT